MRKRIFVLIAMATTLCACNKIENTIPEVQIPEEEIQDTPIVFTATMEGAPETRATYDGTYKCASWEVDDRISINGFDYKANNAGTSTTFSPVVDTEEIRPTFVSSTNTGSYQNQPAQNLVDEGGVDTRWIANKTDMVDSVWNIVVTTGKTTQLKSIKLWNADNQTYPKRRWKSMKVYGSASANGEWTEIGSFANLNLEANKQGLAGEIAINATGGYTHYRIDVLDNEGDKDGWMQMSDMKFVVTPTVNAPYDAYFPASLYDGSIASLPANYTETWADGKFNMPMYAHSENTELQFKNLCGVLKIIVKNDRMSAVKSIRVSSKNRAVSGEFTVADNAAVLTSPNETANTVTVTYSDAVPTTAEGTVFYVAIPAQTYRELKIELSSDGENFTKSMTTKAGADIVVARNKIYPINHTSVLPAGALPGEFSVSPTKKVHFAKGNLQATYDGTKYTWGFAENQDDYIGEAPGNTTIDSQSSGGVVDLFGWSTTGTYYGISNESHDSVYFGDFVDWGKNIDDGNTWRTLSIDEWAYLLNTRTVNGGSGLDKTFSVNIIYGDKMGLVLYPDDYTGDRLSGSVTTLPEGVVFLPTAGHRLEHDVYMVGVTGEYWSSTFSGDNTAYAIAFDSSFATPDHFPHRWNGISVRLVTEVE